jgi:thiamine transporter
MDAAPTFSTEFFESAAGRVAVVIAIFAAIAILAAYLGRKKLFTPKVLTYSAVCIALAAILSRFTLFDMPQGGSVSACAMLFIALAGYWFGPAVGIMVGVTHGLLDLALGPYVIHPVQLLLDYPLAFGAIGIAGFFREHKYGLHIGYTAGVLGRMLMSVLSGVIFFPEYTPEGMNVLWYSITYNGSYMLTEMVITLILISIPAFRSAINKEKARV